ncbi:MAG: hypothetical protein J5679_00045 [Alphaproteobacteria bacterium]|nr:hypothetical protein [Alphaproteobacteria bacterium]
MSKFLFMFLIGVVWVGGDASAVAATNAKTQSAIQNGTTVRARVSVTGIYDQSCYDAYYGCMDQFCIAENDNGGSCACSDKNAEYEQQLADIKKTLDEAERISTIEVEKVRAGANADIIFSGSREYDKDGNVVSVDAKTKTASGTEKRESLLSLWDNVFEDDDEDLLDTIATKTGAALFSAADNLCRAQMDDSCAKDVAFLRQIYSRQITSDCKAF